MDSKTSLFVDNSKFGWIYLFAFILSAFCLRFAHYGIGALPDVFQQRDFYGSEKRPDGSEFYVAGTASFSLKVIYRKGRKGSQRFFTTELKEKVVFLD